MASKVRVREVEEAVEDGRVQRGARNRGRIIDALLELVASGDPLPTAEQVARRAGVGERTVFRHFADMETLFAEVSARIEREVRPLLEEQRITGSLEQRIRAVVERRARLYEKIAPFYRSGMISRHSSEFLQRQHARMNRTLREQLARALEPDLEGARADLLEALDLLTCFESWDRLRTDQRLSRGRAAQIVEATALSLFEHYAK